MAQKNSYTQSKSELYLHNHEIRPPNMRIWCIRPNHLGAYFYPYIQCADIFDKSTVSLEITIGDYHLLTNQWVNAIFLGERWSLCARNLHIPHINLSLRFTYS